MRQLRIGLAIALFTSVFISFIPTPKAPTSPIYAETPELPKPHLGYGIHVAPYTNVDHQWVDRLQMDWVKLYTEEQIPLFPNQKILFRLDRQWPNDWQAFRQDIRVTTQRLAAAGVEAIEVHNEPNLILEWPRGPNGWEYTQLLRVAYTEIKAVAPQIIVVSAGLAPTITTPDRRVITDIDFAREMLENGAGNYFDAFGYHPYGFAYAPEQNPSYGVLNFRRAELIYDLLVQYGLGDKSVWLTEFGWLRDPAAEGISCTNTDPDFQGFDWLRVDEQTQADYIVRAFDYADRNWAWAGPMFLWNLNWSMNFSINPCHHTRWFAILRADGRTTPALERVAVMPRRPVRLLPEMTLSSDPMTVEVGVSCPATVTVGQFTVVNSGSPGTTFTAQIEPAQSLGGPSVTVTPTAVKPGDIVIIYADTRGLPTGVYIIYINIRATIADRLVVRNVRGYVIVTDSFADC